MTVTGKFFFFFLSFVPTVLIESENILVDTVSLVSVGSVL